MTFPLCSITSLSVYVQGTMEVAKVSFVPEMTAQSSLSWCSLTGVSTVELEMSVMHYIPFYKWWSKGLLQMCWSDGANISAVLCCCYVLLVLWWKGWCSHPGPWLCAVQISVLCVGLHSTFLEPGLFAIWILLACGRCLAAIPGASASRKPFRLIS